MGMTEAQTQPSKTARCELFSSSPRLGCHPLSGISTRDQLHLHYCACWGFACSCHLPDFTAIKHWISCSALVLAPMWLCQLLASVTEIRANFQSWSDLGFPSKPICPWLSVMPTTFIAGWDNELLNPQISTTWSSFNSFPLQKVKADSASCVYHPGQQTRGLIANSVNCLSVTAVLTFEKQFNISRMTVTSNILETTRMKPRMIVTTLVFSEMPRLDLGTACAVQDSLCCEVKNAASTSPPST